MGTASNAGGQKPPGKITKNKAKANGIVTVTNCKDGNNDEKKVYKIKTSPSSINDRTPQIFRPVVTVMV